MTDIKLPGVGAVPRGPFIISAVLAAGAGGYILWRHHQNAAAAPAAATAYGYGAGYGYGASYGLGIASYGYGYGMAYGSGTGSITGSGGAGSVPVPVDPGTGGDTGGDTGTGTGTGGGTATTNPQWASEAKGALQSAGMNPATVQAALQLYIGGKTVTQDQAQIVQSAINAVGYPPVAGKDNFPPQIHVSGGGGSGQSPKPGSGSGQIIGKRHVASGTASLVTWAKNNKTGTGEVENTTEQNYQSGYMTSANHNKFTAYLNKGTSSKMPAGLVFFSTH